MFQATAGWSAEWTPWGSPHAITGAAILDTRFPGQWFQLEAGLHYNWHRHYDPSLGRYTQPDPLGFVDGPSVYAYAKNAPLRFVDRDGRNTVTLGGTIGQTLGALTPVPGAALAGRIIGSAIGAAIIMCMAGDERGYWPGDKGAEEWGRRNNVGPREARKKFHEIKQSDKGSRGDDKYTTNPETGDVRNPQGESAGNLGD